MEGKIENIDRSIGDMTMEQDKQKIIARLSALYDISSALNSIVDIDELLRFIIQQTKKLLNVEGVSILLWDRQTDELYFPIVAAEEENVAARLKQSRFSTSSGIAGWVVNEGKPALVRDVSVDQRFYKKVDKSTGFITRSILCVPLYGSDSILGVLEVVNKKEGEFTEDDQGLLETMAGNIAVSIERVQLYKGLQKAEALLRRQNAELRQSIHQKYRFQDIIGNSQIMMDLLQKSEQVAFTDATVLIYGETGTGKDLLAQAIHYSSPRARNSFVPINCSAIPENLLESELFGHEKGAFTDAVDRRIGRFEEANGGTLFLDEIGDMPMSLQVKLLRVLEGNTVRPLGSNVDISVDVRVITATHSNLTNLVAEKRFRQDLYYRLRVFQLELPPLRARREDIPLLINHFIKYYNEKMGRNIQDIDDSALDILYNHDYPGNIRELQHFIESAMIVAKGNVLTPASFPREIRGTFARDEDLLTGVKSLPVPRNNAELKTAKAEARRKAEERVELMFLNDLLSETHGNISEAARHAEMNRSWLSQLVSKHQLDLRQFRDRY